jgi:hypothetical protein
MTTAATSRGYVPEVDLGASYEEVSFETSDGLTLRGWYAPSQNRAAVIGFPGRKGPQRPARVFARSCYGVLLFDRRGESEGDPNAFGSKPELAAGSLSVWGGAIVALTTSFIRARSDPRSGRA